jgi:uncharacterized protein YcgL (UPF0745 family)
MMIMNHYYPMRIYERDEAIKIKEDINEQGFFLDRNWKADPITLEKEESVLSFLKRCKI